MAMGKKMEDAEPKKECPSCGLGVSLEATVCEFCGWDFEEEDEWILQIEKLERELMLEKQKFEPGTVNHMIESTLKNPVLDRVDDPFVPHPPEHEPAPPPPKDDFDDFVAPAPTRAPPPTRQVKLPPPVQEPRTRALKAPPPTPAPKPSGPAPAPARTRTVRTPKPEQKPEPTPVRAPEPPAKPAPQPVQEQPSPQKRTRTVRKVKGA